MLQARRSRVQLPIKYEEHKPTQESGTPDGAQGSHNTKDRKNRHPIGSKLIIIIIIIIITKT
jgi:hypothetical protein